MANVHRKAPAVRKVLLLRAEDQKRLQRLAREQKVSASEIMRRSIHSYADAPAIDEPEMASLLKEMNRALDHAIDAIRSARIELAENNLKIRQQREAQA